ncbi:MAG: lamin tail domain-containing protein [Deltaproteobacteria bacterium]|nr:lamin tail domain-containing protein [Deltaproteobacteria bacterium]MCB9785403.1 lamin tail domain-containing protein [Deltaproteobacteria bacterium]
MVRTAVVVVALVCAAGGWACGGGGGGDADVVTDVAGDAGDADAPDAGDADAPDAVPDGGPDATPDGDADAEVIQPIPGTVVINEVLAADGPDDWIELANAGETAVDLEGWSLTDSDPTHVYAFAAGATLGPGGHLLLTRDPLKGFDFGLSPDDAVVLYDAGGVQADRAVWPPGALLGGRSYGRIPDATGELTVLAVPTPGEPNQANVAPTCGAQGLELGEVCDGGELGGLTCEHLGLGPGPLGCAEDCASLDTTGCSALVGILRINEVESTGSDRIELHNTSADTVALDGYVLSDESGGVYALPAGATLAAGGYRVLVGDQDHTFGLGSEDSLTLEDPFGNVVDAVRWPPYQAVVSYCRRPDGTGAFSACPSASFGAKNP